MKARIPILLIFMLGLSGGVIAQSYLGVYAGVISGKFSGDSPKDFIYTGKLQLDAGIIYDLRIKKDIFISIAPGYLRSGSKLKYPFEVDEDTKEYRDSVDLKLQMLTLPISLKIVSDNQKFQFTGGFELIFPLSLVADNSETKNDITDKMNSVGVNMIFGVGYRIPIHANILIVNLGYSQGLTNLADNLDDEDSLLPRIRYTSFQLTTAWVWPVGKSKK